MLPIALADFFVIAGFISLAEKFAARFHPADEA
jgi:hypothetical protein